MLSAPPKVIDINPGPASSDPSQFVDVNGTAFFTADDGVHGFELWKSNGKPNGTVLVKDINPGSSSSYPRYLTNVNGTLFFSANDGTNGQELWKSNGTAAGTVLVQDINPGSNNWLVSRLNLTNVNGTLFFAANDGTTITRCGRATGRRRAPSWSTISVRACLARSPLPDERERDAVLQRRRSVQGVRAVGAQFVVTVDVPLT